MQKKYLPVEALVDLLEQRGVACDEHAGRTLMREGYYAVINGYGKPFLDRRASEVAGEDRFAAGTTFADIYALFCFDRELRMLTFAELARVEGMMRSIASVAFLDAHPEADAYLREENYTCERDYLLGASNLERHLRAMIRTLDRYADDHEDEPNAVDVRVAHYLEHYDSVPLWVVFTDFSYGNLYHFVALMQKDDQVATCERLEQALGDSPLGNGAARTQLSRRTLVNDLAFQVDVRNLCAHGERLYDAIRYDDFLRMIERFLTHADYAAFCKSLNALVTRYRGVSPVVDRALAGMPCS